MKKKDKLKKKRLRMAAKSGCSFYQAFKLYMPIQEIKEAVRNDKTIYQPAEFGAYIAKVVLK
jgi:hypothetical protein